MEKINMAHLMFIIWGTTIVSMKTNITILLNWGGRDTWLAIAVASVIALLFLIYMNNIMLNTNNFDIVDIYKKALGNILGSILIIMVLLNLLLTLVEGASVEADAMHINLFIETPPWYFILFFVIPAIYSVKRGLGPVVSITIIGVCCAIFAGINLVMLTAPYKDYKHLLPIMAENTNIKFIITVLLALGFYGSLFLVLPFYKYVVNKNKIKTFSVIGFLFVVQMHIVSSVGTIAAFGPSRASNLIFPKLIQTQEISLFGFLESGELFVLFQVVGGWFVKYVITFFVIRELLRSYKIDGKLIIYSVSFVVIAISYFICNKFERLYNFLYLYDYLCLVNYIIIPFIVYTIYKMRNRQSC